MNSNPPDILIGLLDVFDNPVLVVDAAGALVASNHHGRALLANARVETSDGTQLHQLAENLGTRPAEVLARFTESGHRWYEATVRLVADRGSSLRVVSLVPVERPNGNDLRHAREQTIADLATDGLASLDANGSVLFANRAFERMLGESRELLRGRRLVDLVSPGARELVELHLQESHGDSDGVHVDMVRRDGSCVPVHLVATEVGALGAPVRSVAWVKDLTESLQTRSQLRRSEQRLRALVEALPDMVFRFDPEGSYFDVAVADSSLLALPREELEGRSLEEVITAVFPVDVADLVRSTISQVADGGDSQTVSYDLDLDGDLRSFEARITTIDTTELMAVVRDVTELRRAEEQRLEHAKEVVNHRAALARSVLEKELERASKVESIGFLAATMAHDVNGLLGVIGNYASIVRSSTDVREVEAGVDAISVAVERGAELTRRLLRIGRPAIPDERLLLDEVVAEIGTILQRAFASESGVKLTVLNSEKPLAVVGSRSAIEQAVMNLVLNARDATETTGSQIGVTLSLTTRSVGIADERPPGLGEGSFALVAVVDGGGGIPRSRRDQVFEPFFSDKSGENFGLGLPIVRAVATEHRGAVEIHDAVVQGVLGTRVELWLPVDADLR